MQPCSFQVHNENIHYYFFLILFCINHIITIIINSFTCSLPVEIFSWLMEINNFLQIITKNNHHIILIKIMCSGSMSIFCQCIPSVKVATWIWIIILVYPPQNTIFLMLLNDDVVIILHLNIIKRTKMLIYFTVLKFKLQ